MANPATETLAQLEQLWISAGGPAWAAPQAAAISEAESGGNPTNSYVESDGTISRGLWQINSVHGSASTFDPLGNASAAVALWSANNQSFGNASGGPWQAEFIPGSAANARYTAALAQAPAAGAAGARNLWQTVTGQQPAAGTQAAGNVVNAAGNAASGALGTLQASWAGFWTAHPSGLVVAGLVLLVLAAVLVASSSNISVNVPVGGTP